MTNRKNPQYIGMQGTPRYEEMIRKIQTIHAPMTRTDALKMLMEAGSKILLKGQELPQENVRNS